MNPDREIKLGHFRVEGHELRRIEGLAHDIGKNLYALETQNFDGPLCFFDGLIHVVHRQAGHRPDEAVRISGHEFGHFVIDLL